MEKSKERFGVNKDNDKECLGISKVNGDVCLGKGGSMRKMLAEKIKTTYNIRDSKQHYSRIYDLAINGIEVISYKGKTIKKDMQVSHLDKNIADYLFDLVDFTVTNDFDEELGIYTIMIDPLFIYGEGSTIDQAVKNLIANLYDYVNVYIDNFEVFSKQDKPKEKAYTLKLIRLFNSENIEQYFQNKL